MNRFDEDLIIGKPFGAVFLGGQWLGGVLQQGWTEKVEHKTKSGRYLGTFQRERWENVPGTPPGGGDLERGRLGEGERETETPGLLYFWVKYQGKWDVSAVEGAKYYLPGDERHFNGDFFDEVGPRVTPPAS